MEDLTSLIPVIKRARGYRLYSISGRRYVDLALSGGYNLLGHRPTSFINGLKQVCEKGLLSDLPSIYGRRLVKIALLHLISGRLIVLYGLGNIGGACPIGFSAGR